MNESSIERDAASEAIALQGTDSRPAETKRPLPLRERIEVQGVLYRETAGNGEMKRLLAVRLRLYRRWPQACAVIDGAVIVLVWWVVTGWK